MNPMILSEIENAMNYAEDKRTEASDQNVGTNHRYWDGQVAGILKVLAIIEQHGC